MWAGSWLQIAEDIRQTINNHDEIIPTILEIPSKDIKYDPEKDSIMQRAAKQLYGGDAAQLKLDEDWTIEILLNRLKYAKRADILIQANSQGSSHTGRGTGRILSLP